jgi:cytochrome c556
MAAMVAGAVLATGGLGGNAQAEDASKIIAYRHNVMGANAAHITQIAMVAKGEVPFTDQVAGNARAIATAAIGIPAVFPEGTSLAEVPADGENGAKPEIWQQWDKFTAAAENLEIQANKLADIAENGGDVAAIGVQLGELGKACGGCHEPFRKKN